MVVFGLPPRSIPLLHPYSSRLGHFRYFLGWFATRSVLPYSFDPRRTPRRVPECPESDVGCESRWEDAWNRRGGRSDDFDGRYSSSCRSRRRQQSKDLDQHVTAAQPCGTNKLGWPVNLYPSFGHLALLPFPISRFSRSFSFVLPTLHFTLSPNIAFLFSM